MGVFYYDGHLHPITPGSFVHHRLSNPNDDPGEGFIRLEVGHHDAGKVVMWLDCDQARQLATTLLRDVGLYVDGAG